MNFNKFLFLLPIFRNTLFNGANNNRRFNKFEPYEMGNILCKQSFMVRIN